MEKAYQAQKAEKNIYAFWEKGGWFTPETNPKRKPFSILLPLPNANDPLHMGHALFAIQDIMIRYHRMLGQPALWLPGGDHAGIETQFVFEKELNKKGQSRFDFDRQTLYQMIASFVEKNKGINIEQMKQLGFSLDWTRYHYSLEAEILKTVFDTFRKLHADGLVYRDEKLVNYCPHCGTAFSELEVIYKERKDPLYYLKYGPFTLATVRPETKFGDTAVAVNPQDKRYQKWIGKEFAYQSLIGPRQMKVIADELVDPKFGTGVVKVTPAHDPNDYEMAQKHKLKIIKVINPDGKLNENTGRFAGLTINQAREKVVAELKTRGDLVKIDKNYQHRVGTCYRCGTIIEPTLMPQWFIKIKPLAQLAVAAVKKGKTKVVPKKRFEKMYFQWLENIHDWNISRQIVWGPRIPAWYCLDCHPEIKIDFIDQKNERVSGQYADLKAKYELPEIKKGLQSLTAPKKVAYSLKPQACQKCGGKNILQETDTFDTWFLSGQWPLTTLGFPKSRDFKYFYPTSVLDTLWDILFFWVARMMMLGLYRTGKVPFKVIHLHCRVVDKKGQKMSKSKGNVINPIEVVEKYGADALRMALVFGHAPGSDIALGEDQLRAMRNFANKIWNAARFILANKSSKSVQPSSKSTHPEDKAILKKLQRTIKKVTENIEKYRFDLAFEAIYQFFWHTFCDQYLEASKQRRTEAQPTLYYVLEASLKLLHPFMPFLTEEVYQKLPNHGQALMIEKWPK